MKFNTYTELISELQQSSSNGIPFDEGIKQLGVIIPDNSASYDHDADIMFKSLGVTEEQIDNIGKDYSRLRTKILSVTKSSVVVREIEQFLIKNNYSRTALFVVLTIAGQHKWEI